MDTKLKLMLASFVALVGLSQTDASATSTLSVTHRVFATHVVGQLGTTAKDASRAEVEQLLANARKAMVASNWDLAESLIQQAEKKNVRFGLFHPGDTPKRARRDLENSRKKSGGVSLPSQRYSPTSAPAEASKDPFVARDAIRQAQADSQGTSQNPIELAAADRAADRIALPARSTPSPANRNSPFGNQTNAAPLPPLVTGNATALGESVPQASPNRQQSDAALLAARHALAVGDTRLAQQHMEKAKAFAVRYDFQEDSPAKVEAAIRKYTDVVGRGKGRENTEGWRRQKAEVLMEQAEALLAWQDVKEAERLASDAQQLGVKYSPFEASPKTLLSRIAKEQANGKSPSRLPVPLTGSGPSVAQAPAQNSAPAASDKKALAISLAQQARAALTQGDLARAGRLVQEAQSLQVPDSQFAANEDRPWLVALDIQKAQATQQAQYAATPADRYADRADYVPSQDTTSNVPAGLTRSSGRAPLLAQQTPPPGRLQTSPELSSRDSTGLRLFKQGQQALRNQDKDAALRFFREAYAQQEGLDPVIRQQLQDHLQLLSAGVAKTGPGQGSGSLLEDAAARQQMLARQLSAEVAKQQSDARRVREKNPKQALKSLEEMKVKVTDSGLDPAVRTQLLRRVDLSITELERFVQDNRAQIELDEQNREVRGERERRQQAKLDVQEKLAELIEQFNQLVNEQQYEQAEVRAKQALELAPEEPVARQVWQQARLLRRIRQSDAARESKEEATWAALQRVHESSSPFDDGNPYIFPNEQQWDALSVRRAELLQRNKSGRKTERELEIERKLKTPVSLQFSDRPLAEVMDHLGKLTGVNVHLDPRGLSEEGVTSNTPVSIALHNEISLRSALNLILQPLHLSYVIKDEVLKITSEQMRDGEVYTVTYNVADLVIPIPNFVPGSQLGMQGQLNDAYNALGYGNTPGSASPLSVVASNTGQGGTGMINPQVLAQMQGGGGGMMGGGMGSGIGMGPAAGPGGLGGGAEADFDSLIELITATIQPNTWDEVGGPGSVKEFETNLSLVVSQTQDVHEEIVDLLEQLRRLQDLQVTIEVRFIRLSDSFFERIGVDFDFNIKNGTAETINTIADTQNSTAPVDPSNTVGYTQNGFTSNLDLQFDQDSFTATVPQFGGFDPATAANFGFAILSDIEAYFLITAAQGDSRSNILQAPKVTLFNGQQAFVSDTSQTPFVISVIPVVGDFAAAQQPVIVVLSEGTFMTIQAVVSNDRRYVRLTVVPFFSQIRDVDTFTFEGSTTTTSASSESGLDDNDNPTDTSNDTATTRQGTTVQLPTFAFVTVTTTVSVPDGGTVLLGGIKRLSESRVETGVPILSKVPYVSRLFRNVGIGRDTESLMMMVTPRIIIQEEEEERLGIGGQ